VDASDVLEATKVPPSIMKSLEFLNPVEFPVAVKLPPRMVCPDESVNISAVMGKVKVTRNRDSPKLGVVYIHGLAFGSFLCWSSLEALNVPSRMVNPFVFWKFFAPCSAPKYPPLMVCPSAP